MISTSAGCGCPGYRRLPVVLPERCPHGVLRPGECWNWSRHFSRAFGAPGALVPPRLELKAESDDQSLRHVSNIRYWDELLMIFEAMLYDLYAFSTMWSSLHFKHLQHIQAPSVWLGEGSWGLYSGHQWRFHGATAHSAADTSGALTLCSSWFVWSVWSDWDCHPHSNCMQYNFPIIFTCLKLRSLRLF